MRFPVPQITTFFLLVHMVFGCCLHHAHTCETNCCTEPTATAEACHCGTHRHDELSETAASGLGERGDHSEPHDCAGDHCTYLQSQPSPKLPGEFAADSYPLESVVTHQDLESFRSQLNRSLGRHFFVAANSLRPHLALRVLLI